MEAQLARQLVRTINKSGGKFDKAAFLCDYVNFMTTAGSHNDTYATSNHRLFFSRWAQKIPPEQCPYYSQGFDTIDALTAAIPVILKFHYMPRKDLYKLVFDEIRVMRKVCPSLFSSPVRMLTDIIIDLLEGNDLRHAIENNVQAYLQISVSETLKDHPEDPTSACPLNQSLPVALLLCYRYADSPEQAVLKNAMAGGASCGRGAIIGALLGAAHGQKKWPFWATDGLIEREQIFEEMEEFFQEFQNKSISVHAIYGKRLCCPAPEQCEQCELKFECEVRSKFTFNWDRLLKSVKEEHHVFFQPYTLERLRSLDDQDRSILQLYCMFAEELDGDVILDLIDAGNNPLHVDSLGRSVKNYCFLEGPKVIPAKCVALIFTQQQCVQMCAGSI